MPSYREDRQMGEEIAALLPHYGDKTNTIRAAVHLLYRLRRMEQMQGLILDLDLPLDEVVYRAILELWQREVGEGERDVLAELDEVKRRLDEAGL